MVNPVCFKMHIAYSSIIHLIRGAPTWTLLHPDWHGSSWQRHRLWDQRGRKAKRENTPKIVFTMLCVDVWLLIDSTSYYTIQFIYYDTCLLDVLFLFATRLQASFQCFQADEEDEWPLSSVQAPWGVDISTKMVGSQRNLWLTSKILNMSSS